MSQRVIVIGSSLAGLVAAFRLNLHGYAVTILEIPYHRESRSTARTSDNNDIIHANVSSKQISKQESTIPLVLYGNSKNTTSLLEEINQRHHLKQLVSVPIELAFLREKTRTFLKWPLPSPWHTLIEVIRFPGLSLTEKWSILNYIEKVWEHDIALPTTLDLQKADSWLTSIGQNKLSQGRVWEPLCRFLLGTYLSQTHAGNFSAALKQVFLESSRQFPAISPKLGIAQLLLNPLRSRLREEGVVFHQIASLKQIQIKNNEVAGLRTEDGSVFTAECYVMALAPHKFTFLIPERLLARHAFFHQLNQIHKSSALQIDFYLTKPIKKPRLILQNGTFPWILCRPLDTYERSKTLISCFSTEANGLQSQTDTILQSDSKKEIKHLFSFFDEEQLSNDKISLTTIHHYSFVPQCVNTTTFRPSNRTPLLNFFLAGSWTDTQALTNVESSVRSGNFCAAEIIEKKRTSRPISH